MDFKECKKIGDYVIDVILKWAEENSQDGLRLNLVYKYNIAVISMDITVQSKIPFSLVLNILRQLKFELKIKDFEVRITPEFFEVSLQL